MQANLNSPPVPSLHIRFLLVDGCENLSTLDVKSSEQGVLKYSLTGGSGPGGMGYCLGNLQVGKRGAPQFPHTIYDADTNIGLQNLIVQAVDGGVNTVKKLIFFVE